MGLDHDGRFPYILNVAHLCLNNCFNLNVIGDYSMGVLGILSIRQNQILQIFFTTIILYCFAMSSSAIADVTMALVNPNPCPSLFIVWNLAWRLSWFALPVVFFGLLWMRLSKKVKSWVLLTPIAIFALAAAGDIFITFLVRGKYPGCF